MSSPQLNDDNESNDNPRTPLLKKAANPITTTATNVLSKSKSKSPEWIASAFQNWFGWEIISAVVAVVSLGAVAGVLATYDGSSLPDWPSAITVCSFSSFQEVVSICDFGRVLKGGLGMGSLLFHCCLLSLLERNNGYSGREGTMSCPVED